MVSRLDRMTDWFWNSPTGLKLIEDEKIARETKRQQLIKRLSETLKRHEKLTAESHARRKAAEDKYLALVEQLKTCYQTEVVQAQMADRGAAISREKEEGKLRRELAEMAPDEITIFVSEMWAERDRLMYHVSPRTNVATDKSIGGDTIFVSAETNTLAIERRLQAVRDAINEAEQMQYTTPRDKIIPRLEELRQSLPPVEMQAVKPVNGRWANEWAPV